MRIFYVANGVFRAGGQFVNLDHVEALRRLGYDARFLIVPPAGAAEPYAPEFPAGRQVPWQRETSDLTASDVTVVGEMFGAGAAAAGRTPARKVLHNQGPFYTFRNFPDLPALVGWGCEAMIAASGFGADMVARIGWELPLHVVRPALDPAFRTWPRVPRELQVAAMINRRPQEARLIRGILCSRRPDLADIPWTAIAGLPRTEVARILAGSAVFLALGQLEGLGLPPLEAMACGALVVGFHGGGGQEYATPENGDWFDDGRHFELVEALERLLDGLRAGERFVARRAAGARTAAEFSQEAFEAQLAQAWAAIAGPL